MLNKKEKYLMKIIFNKCKGKDTCLISPAELINLTSDKYDFNNVEISEILNDLQMDNYINVVNSDKKGKLIYCISLNPKGKSFERENENFKKKTINKILVTILLAILSFMVGLILKKIFS